jgi:hypothetical protein
MSTCFCSSPICQKFGCQNWASVQLPKVTAEYFQTIPLPEKKPYRCPVCYGNGEWELSSIEETIRNNNEKIKKCHSCEGKGIVWSP